MALLDVLFYLQLVICALAISFNSLLIYLVLNHTENRLGFYRWIIIFFAIFETIYALVIILGMPVHIVAYGSWMAYNFGGILSGTKYAYIGPALYCSFYEMWLIFLSIQFCYRYVVLSRPEFAAKVEQSRCLKVLFTSFVVLFILSTLGCGLYLCTRQTLYEDTKRKIENEFGVANVNHSDYVLLRIKDDDGNQSIFGIITIANHHALVLASTLVMLFCSYKINLSIQQLRKMGTSLRRIKMQRQLFVSLILQTCVPVLFCHVPSIIFLSFPFLETDFSFGYYSLFFTFLTSIEKALDPLIVIYCISDCRKAVRNGFGKALLSAEPTDE